MTTRAERHQEHAGNYVLSPGADLNLGVDIIQIPSDDDLKCISKQSVRNVNVLASRVPIYI